MSCSVSPRVDPDLDILLEKLTTNRRLHLKAPSTYYALRVEDLIKSLSFFNFFSGNPYFDALIIEFF